MKKRKSAQWLSVDARNGRYKRVPYKTIDGRPAWTIVKEVIFNLEIGETISRRALHEKVFDVTIADSLLKRGSMSSVDSYRAIFTKCTIIKPTDKLGIYEKARHFPEKLTLQRAREYGYCNNYKKWFVPYEEWMAK